MEFSELALHPDLQRGIADTGYVNCMPVQEQVLANAFRGQDLYVQSQTGTGKTAAFLIVIFQRLLTEPLLGGKKALVMVPTRELAVQVEEEARAISKYLPFKTGSFYGGVGYAQQQRLLRDNVQLLVGTPGRVLDLNKSGAMNLMEIAFLVLDEADRMFDMGFYPDLRKLIRVIPPADRRQTMLFSATLNAYVKNLAWEYTKEPFEIEIASETVTVDEVEQVLYHVPSNSKMKMLLGILQNEKPESAIIFCNTKRYAEIAAKRLRVNGYECEFIIGDLPQVKRLKIIEDVKAGRIRYLAATDVAARGLDIEGLAMVVNYDLPAEAENYVHRIGRTARAGKTGKAITLASEQDVYELPAIERYIGKKIPSQIAHESLFAEDKSEGLRIRTDFYDDRRDDRGRSRDRAGGRSGERGARRERGREERAGTSAAGGSRERARGEEGARSEKFVAPAAVPADHAGAKRSGRGARSEGRRSETGRGADRPKLSEMSMEERMAYYKAKYGDSAAESSPTPAGRGEKHGGRGNESARRPRNGGNRKRGERNEGRREGGTGENSGHRHGTEGGGQKAGGEPAAPKTKSIFGTLMGLFKKES
ncbi:MAG: DEAD/DEAH box helicase [Treponema sp.]|jgi:ATP-dependent RNA helicase RhlB|nr:DEAD/DEAH box helicase [Treponema sp.]